MDNIVGPNSVWLRVFHCTPTTLDYSCSHVHIHTYIPCTHTYTHTHTHTHTHTRAPTHITHMPHTHLYADTNPKLAEVLRLTTTKWDTMEIIKSITPYRKVWLDFWTPIHDSHALLDLD